METKEATGIRHLISVKVSLNSNGCLVIDAPAVCAQRLETNDIAELRNRTMETNRVSHTWDAKIIPSIRVG